MEGIYGLTGKASSLRGKGKVAFTPLLGTMGSTPRNVQCILSTQTCLQTR